LKHRREREIKLLPQTHSPEVDYSLFMAVSMVVMLERLEKRPVLTLQRFSLQSSLEQPLFLCFVFLCRLLDGTPQGVFI
jgi:hypothetical protein